MANSMLTGRWEGMYYSHLAKLVVPIAGRIRKDGWFEFLYQNIPPCTGRGSILTRGIKGVITPVRFVDLYWIIQGKGAITEPPRGVNCQTIPFTLNGLYQMGLIPNLLGNVWVGQRNIGQFGVNKV